MSYVSMEVHGRKDGKADFNSKVNEKEWIYYYALIFNMIVSILAIIPFSYFIFYPEGWFNKIGPHIISMIAAYWLSILVNKKMKFDIDDLDKFAWRWAWIMGFVILDAKAIMGGWYLSNIRKHMEINYMRENDYWYASMRMFMDFVLFFLLMIR